MTNHKYIDPKKVFDSLEEDRKSGALSKSIANRKIKYQKSIMHPNKIECILPDDTRLVGRFKDGLFIPDEENN